MNSILNEMIKDDPNSDSSTDKESAAEDTTANLSAEEDDDYSNKVETAIDYSDIDELAEDLQIAMLVKIDFFHPDHRYS